MDISPLTQFLAAIGAVLVGIGTLIQAQRSRKNGIYGRVEDLEKRVDRVEHTRTEDRQGLTRAQNNLRENLYSLEQDHIARLNNLEERVDELSRRRMVELPRLPAVQRSES